jgi:hypothetical protein
MASQIRIFNRNGTYYFRRPVPTDPTDLLVFTLPHRLFLVLKQRTGEKRIGSQESSPSSLIRSPNAIGAESPLMQ